MKCHQRCPLHAHNQQPAGLPERFVALDCSPTQPELFASRKKDLDSLQVVFLLVAVANLAIHLQALEDVKRCWLSFDPPPIGKLIGLDHSRKLAAEPAVMVNVGVDMDVV